MSIVHRSGPIVLVGGSDLGPQDLNIPQRETATFVAVDSGADHLLRLDIAPAAVIGDFDSLSAQARAKFHNVLHHIPEQNTVDFEKALTRVDAPLIYAVGFAGGRLDHTLAVLHVMGRHADRPVILLSSDDASIIVPQRALTLHLALGTRLSLMPLTPATVQASGLKWSVNNQPMTPTGFTSPSNETSCETVTLFATGCVILTVPRGSVAALAQAVAHAQSHKAPPPP